MQTVPERLLAPGAAALTRGVGIFRLAKSGARTGLLTDGNADGNG